MSSSRSQQLLFSSVVSTTKYTYLWILAAFALVFFSHPGAIPLKVQFEEFLLSRATKVLLYGLVVGSTWLWLRRSRPGWSSSLLAAGLHVGSLALLFRVEGLGDEYNWTKWVSESNRLPWSEALGLAVYRVAFLVGFPFPLIAPIFGFLLVSAVVLTANRMGAVFGNSKIDLRPLSYLFYAASPISFLFLPGYVELTFVSLPMLYLSLIHLLEFVGAKERRDALYSSAFWASFACCVHGIGVTLLPLWPIACVLRLPKDPFWKLFFKRIAACLAILAVVVAFVYLSLGLLGFEVFHLNKGNDGSYVELDFFSVPHALLVANIFYLTMPIFFVWWFLFPRYIWPRLQASAAPYSLLVAGIVGFYCFAILYGFDMGYPLETDIMISLGIVIPLFFSALYAGLENWRQGSRMLIALAFLNGLLTWWALTPNFRAGLLFRLAKSFLA